MSFIQRELDRIQSALGAAQETNRAALLAAQQALSWVLDPSAFQPPLFSITGNSEDSEDCSAGTRRPPSSHNGAPNEGVASQ